MTEESRRFDQGVDTTGPMTFNGLPVRKPDGTPFGWGELVEGKEYRIDPVTGTIEEGEGTLVVTPGFHQRMADTGVNSIAFNTEHVRDFIRGLESRVTDLEMKPSPGLNEAIITVLARKFSEIVKEHYLKGPPHPDRIYELLNAMAFPIVMMFAGVRAKGGEDAEQAVYQFFFDAIQANLVNEAGAEDAFDKLMSGADIDASWGGR